MGAVAWLVIPAGCLLLIVGAAALAHGNRRSVVGVSASVGGVLGLLCGVYFAISYRFAESLIRAGGSGLYQWRIGAITDDFVRERGVDEGIRYLEGMLPWCLRPPQTVFVLGGAGALVGVALAVLVRRLLGDGEPNRPEPATSGDQDTAPG